MNEFDTNALRARIMKQYVQGKEELTLSAAMRMDQREIAANNASVDSFAQLVLAYGKMTEEQREIFIKVMDLVIGRPDRQQYVLNYKGNISDLPAALARI